MAHLEAILWVGTTTVRALVIAIEAGRVIVWGYGRASHDSGYGREGRTVDREHLAACCETALATAEAVATEAAGQPMIADDVQIGVSGAILWSYVPAVQRRRVEPNLPISDDELERLLRSLVRAAQNTTETLSRQTHLRMQLFSLSPITIHLDDQWVTDPCGFLGEALQARAFAAYAPRHYLETLRFVADQLDLDVSGLITLPQALIQVTPQTDAVILKIGGTTTQVMQIEHRCPSWFDRFAVGGTTFTQEIASKIGLLPERAEAAKIHYAGGGGDDDTRHVWTEILSPVCNEWLERLVDVLRIASKVHPLPPTITYCGGGSAMPNLFANLAYDLQICGLPFAQTPEIHPLSVRAIRGWDDHTNTKWDAGDVPAIGVALNAAASAGHDTLSIRLSQLMGEQSS